MELDEATDKISLTDKEVAILRLIAAGQSTNRIAHSMNPIARRNHQTSKL